MKCSACFADIIVKCVFRASGNDQSVVALESDVVIDVIFIHITARFVSVYYRH